MSGRRRPVPDAAVLPSGHPDGAKGARTVPPGAKVVRLTPGGATAGYTVGRARRKLAFADMRLAEVERVIVSRHGVPRVDTDDHEYLVFVAHHVEPNRAVTWAQRWYPKLTAEEVHALVSEATCSPRRWRADRAADFLGVTFRERQRLGLRTIGSTDVRRGARIKLAAEAKREADRERARQKRRAAGAKSRDESVAAQARSAKVSRSTIYRRRNAASKKPCDAFVANISEASIGDETVAGKQAGDAEAKASGAERPQCAAPGGRPRDPPISELPSFLLKRSS